MNIIKWSRYLAILTMVLIIPTLCYCVYALYCPVLQEERVVIIPKGSGLHFMRMALKPYQPMFLHNERVFYFFAKLYKEHKGFHKTIRAGEYALPKGSSFIEMLAIILRGKVTQHKVTIPEGCTVLQAVKILKRSYGVIDDLGETLPNEGSLLPETYFYTFSTSIKELLQRMIFQSDAFIDRVWLDRDSRISTILKSKEEALVLASIIEKETALSVEKARIAGVYLNRLKRHMRLQADPTVIYGIEKKANRVKRLTLKDLKYPSEYNTYLNSGLPPTPICNPSKESILSSLHPVWTKELYFVSDGLGGHIFATNFASHLQNIRYVRDNK